MGKNNELWPWKEATAVTKLTVNIEKIAKWGRALKKMNNMGVA